MPAAAVAVVPVIKSEVEGLAATLRAEEAEFAQMQMVREQRLIQRTQDRLQKSAEAARAAKEELRIAEQARCALEEQSRALAAGCLLGGGIERRR